MTKFVCNSCHSIHEENDLRVVTESDPFATGDTWYTEKYVYCPTCDSDDVDEAFMCSTCGEDVVEEGYDDCAKCVAANPEYD